MFDISFPVALWAGLLSFFAPCVIPLFPAYVAYISGDSVSKLKNEPEKFRKKVVISSLFYILGFSLTFAILGTSIAGIGVIFRLHSDFVRVVGGSLIVLFGLQLAEIIKIPTLKKGGIVRIPKWADGLGNFRPFLIGVVFASTWAPCVGPILGSILALSIVQQTALQGLLLLFTYSLGISIPFFVASLMLSKSQKYMNSIRGKLAKITKVSGCLMVVLGVLMLTNKLGFVNKFFTNLF